MNKITSMFKNRTIDVNIETLKLQSRSFAIPILGLDAYLQIPIMVEYNLNKTIDTIEDSLTLEPDEKKDLIQEFCHSLSYGCVSAKLKRRMIALTPKDERYVFLNYGSTIHLFNSLSVKEQELAYTQTLEMAQGMTHYFEQPIETMQDLNKYCYFVAGTVGIYLVELYNIHHPTKENNLIKQKEYALGFGRFLQKLNIIRDFMEDQCKNQGSYWPTSIISKFEDKLLALNYLCKETLENDATHAIKFYEILPENNSSFDAFIKFILFSSIEYIKILKNNKSVFSKIKVKLPKQFISGLYKKTANMPKTDFIKICHDMVNKELKCYEKLIFE